MAVTKRHILWNDTKNQTNQAKHGVSFEVAAGVFRDPLHVSTQARIEDYEMRWNTIGEVQGASLLIVAHVTTEASDIGDSVEVVRIISARRATRRERKTYEG